MARHSHLIRDIVLQAFELGRASRDLQDFRTALALTLLPEVGEDENLPEFADVYAQTLVYGLFAAWTNHREGEFRRQGAAAEIPRTAPLLRRIFETLTGTALDDEPHAPFVNDLVAIFQAADQKSVLRDFAQGLGHDPVVHFYETFLSEYDPKLREKRGVYYTPTPVVSYIVRSIDSILQRDFALADGLADHSLVELTRRVVEDGPSKGTTIVREFREKRYRLQILDPACGTGTFLFQVVNRIRERFIHTKDAGRWSGYVTEHLLPRLFGFELLMAPYAIAHFKLTLQLSGRDLPEPEHSLFAYEFRERDRLNIFLTNTLESLDHAWPDLYGPYQSITDEARAATDVKRDMPIMVILGNPPYAGHSANKGEWIRRLVRWYSENVPELAKPAQAKWLQDDYVKFIRWAQWKIERTGAGVVGFITNHAYIDNPTFRGMRERLMQGFDQIYILNLHGNANRKETAPDGGPDKNVFDIKQGVSITLLVKRPGVDSNKQVKYADVWGTRERKYEYLSTHDVLGTEWSDLKPKSPYFLFIPSDEEVERQYLEGFSVRDLFSLVGDPPPGIVTTQDEFAITWSREEVAENIRRLIGTSDEAAARRIWRLCSQKQWNYANAKATLSSTNWDHDIGEIVYRPFDKRWTAFNRHVAVWWRERATPHIRHAGNIALSTSRGIEVRKWEHALVVDAPIQHHAVSIKEVDFFFPLYLYPSTSAEGPPIPQASLAWPTGRDGRMPNLHPVIVTRLSEVVGMQFTPDGPGDLDETFGPEDILAYVYATLHSPSYREQFASSLRRDFPRIPWPTSRPQFIHVAQVGKQLVRLHLFQVPSARAVAFPVPGTNRIENGYPTFEQPAGRIRINSAQYFEGIPLDAWEFTIGGYQVLRQWLSDRRGRILTFSDIEHFEQIVRVAMETPAIVSRIDRSEEVPA